MIEAGAFGQIIEVNAGFLHGSDLNPHKPINWKRIVEYNGAYGVMGDLGPHVCTIPLRAGWVPRNVRAVLSNIVRARPDGKGNVVPCETWDNATLLCEARDPASGSVFPLTLRAQRIAPGEKNNWYLEIYGTRASVRFSLNEANTLQQLEYTPGGEATWQTIHLGHEVAYPSITAEIFQFGVGDAILQMWAAFLYELDRGESSPTDSTALGSPGTPGRFAGCATPAESMQWHRLFTAALESQAQGTTVAVA